MLWETPRTPACRQTGTRLPVEDPCFSGGGVESGGENPPIIRLSNYFYSYTLSVCILSEIDCKNVEFQPKSPGSFKLIPQLGSKEFPS